MTIQPPRISQPKMHLKRVWNHRQYPMTSPAVPPASSTAASKQDWQRDWQHHCQRHCQRQRKPWTQIPRSKYHIIYIHFDWNLTTRKKPLTFLTRYNVSGNSTGNTIAQATFIAVTPATSPTTDIDSGIYSSITMTAASTAALHRQQYWPQHRQRQLTTKILELLQRKWSN